MTFMVPLKTVGKRLGFIARVALESNFNAPHVWEGSPAPTLGVECNPLHGNLCGVIHTITWHVEKSRHGAQCNGRTHHKNLAFRSPPEGMEHGILIHVLE